MTTPQSQPAATARSETPVFFPAGGEHIFGVVTEPAGDPLGTAVIIAMGGGFQTSAHVNRFAVLLARRLAGEGYHTMRFDYHGLGESSGTLRGYRLDDPFVEDAQGAVQWFRSRGVDRFVLVGSCGGGRTALAVAGRLRGVEGLALITTPVIDLKMGEGTPARRMVETSVWKYLGRGFRLSVLRRFFPPYSFRRQARIVAAHLRLGLRVGWRRLRGKLARESSEGMEVNPAVISDLEAMVRQRVPILFVYGDEDPFRKPVEPGGSRRIAQILAGAGRLFELRTVPGTRAHRFVSGQEQMVDLVSEWLARDRALRSPSARSAG